MIWTVLFILPVFSMGATFDIDWVLGVSETLEVGVGDTIKFNWGQSISHNVNWSPPLFPTSETTNDLNHVETYVVPRLASGNDYIVICNFHPTMRVIVRVGSDENITSAPTKNPTSFPTVVSTGGVDEMTTIANFGIIIASVVTIVAVGIYVWSYWIYTKNPVNRPMKIKTSYM